MLQPRVRDQGEAKGQQKEGSPGPFPGSLLLPDTFPPLQVTLAFHRDEFKVELPDGYELTFPNRLGYSHLSYLCVKGGLQVSSLKLN